jgi:pyruvyl transferase EpsO
MGEVIAPGSRVALLDFPNHGNVGDSAIWLGELAALRILGASVVYVATMTTFREEALRRALGQDGLVLLHGGGNFGDLWPPHHAHREQVATALRDLRLIQLPQSIHFQDPSRQAQTRNVLRRHPRLTVLARDRRSLGVAQDQLDLPALLCPDSAFALTLPPPRLPQTRDVIWLSRDDKEGPGDTTWRPNAPIPRVDWIHESMTWRRRLDAALGRVPDVPNRVTEWLFRSLAWERVRRGCDLIGQGRVLVTNRLHGQLLAMLMGVPHFVSDTRQGKLGDFFRTWLEEHVPDAICDSEEVALARAIALASRSADHPRTELANGTD